LSTPKKAVGTVFTRALALQRLGLTNVGDVTEVKNVFFLTKHSAQLFPDWTPSNAKSRLQKENGRQKISLFWSQKGMK